jgi:DNA-binding transcriptional ArsR family regulator
MTVDIIHKALANRVRRDILVWLKHPDLHFPDQQLPIADGVCASAVHLRCKLSQSTVSAHLAVLLNANLVTCSRSGHWTLFKRNEAAIQAFREHVNAAL